MQKILLTAMLVFLLSLCTMAIFSCEIVDVNFEETSGAKIIDQQDVVYDQTIHQPDE